MSDLQAYKRGGTLPSLPSVPPRSSPFFRAQHSFEPPAAASNTNISTSNTTSSREEAKDLLGRDTREISAGLSVQLPSKLNQLCNAFVFAEIHKYKESIALLSRTLAELGQEVGFCSSIYSLHNAFISGERHPGGTCGSGVPVGPT